MTPEMKLAESLGGIPSTPNEKLAEAIRELSLEELKELMKEAGVVIDTRQEKVAAAMEKIAMADRWGRELAHAHFEKVAVDWGGMVSKAKGVVAPMAQKAVSAITPTAQKFMQAGTGARAGIGAAAGGAAGMAAGALQTPQQGQSRFGNAMKKGIGGAALGAGAGAAAPGAATFLHNARGAAPAASRGGF